MNQISCPNVRDWQALLEGERKEDELEVLTHHLESCNDCQQTLESLVAGPAVWQETACALGEQWRQAGQEPMLRHVVKRLKEEIPATSEADLSFLQPADDPNLLGLLGAYRVQEVIGRGGMGLVLKAFDPVLHRLVAIKVLDPALAGNATARKRFTRETQAAAAVCHDHIVAVHGVSEAGELPYLVMQLIAGESLQARLDREGPLPVADVVRIGLQTTSGLAAAHAQGLIHRDIKPANLLLENGLSRVKITDFGLARMSDDVGLTQNDVVAGTPEYMAPEQARAEVVDHRADLFSLESVLYACCTGKVPFRGSTTLAVLSQVNEKEPAPAPSLNPDVSAWLETFIAQLMAKDAAQRFQSAAEVAALLEEHLTHLQQPRRNPPPLLPLSTGRNQPVAPLSSPARAASRLWPTLLIVGMLVVPVSLGLLQKLAGVDGPAAKKDQPPEWYFDFRGAKLPPPSLSLWSGTDGSEVIEAEEKGLRIGLPGGRTNTYPVGLVLRTTVQGNFEITTGYEIVRADKPQKGMGVGYELYVTMESPSRDAIGLTHVKCPDGSDQYMCARNTTVKEKRKFYLQTFAANGRSGRLRLTRKGAEIIYLAAEGDAADFRELWRQPLPSADVSAIRMGAYPGQAPEAVEVRLVDVRIRSDVPLLASSGDGDSVADRKVSDGTRKWLAALAIMVLLALSSLGVSLLVRRRLRRGNSLSPAAVPDGKIPENQAAPSISLRCSSCEKPMKVKASLAGKKIKCPQCGKAVAVPAADTYSTDKPEPLT